ncbi:MAG: XRE family transcriptional regulator [Candidatus Amulumruptor caecigallinarius]|nr:XRE family transcriptional regulator [Candidatus Amulumruptor caecigallinarius]MCM1396621.1 XRE family transcriptional regulator [Candidatus Amulumruptor caecigallinarius]MCM1453321.1 XRE family transcriptional regulator [bacterium]
MSTDSQAILSRIRHLIDMSRMSQAQFARRIGIDPSNMSKHLTGKLPVTDGLINRIVADMGVSKQWLRDGTDIPFPKGRGMRTIDAAEIDDTTISTRPAIPVYDIDVTAGAMPLERLLTEDRIVGSVALPQINPSDVIVRVNGDSMTPVIRDGGYIAIRPISDPSIIFWGQIYVVLLDDYRMVKYLRRCPDDPSMVLLRSANEAYDDIEVRRADIRRLFIVDAVLNYDIRV